MPAIGIIGGSAYSDIKNLEVTRREMINTPYGSPSCPVVFGEMNGGEVVFIHRHGFGHTIAPHEINYRANIWALKKLGVDNIIAIGAVGGITKNMSPLNLVIPHQIIDYTHSRKHTFHDSFDGSAIHVEFTHPYSKILRQVLTESATKLQINCEHEGVYGATQGPRLETAAEIERLLRDGCDVVGMTGMPEASLARELDMSYACCAVVVNWAAGKGEQQTISLDEISKNMKAGMVNVHQLLTEALLALTNN